MKEDASMKQIKDERIEQAKNQIRAELMMIFFFIVVISYCVKSIYFGMDLRQLTTEFILLILAPVYQTVRCKQLGVVLNSGNGGSMRQLAVVGVVVLLFLLVLARSHAQNQQIGLPALLNLLVFLAIFVALRSFVLFLEHRRAKRLENRYDDEP